MTNRLAYSPEDVAGLIVERAVNKYSPDQPRDEKGQFSFTNADLSASETTLRDGGKVNLSPKEALALVRQIGSHEVANGERNTLIDLNQIHIKGTGLFDSQNLGIPRSQMPQVPETLRPEFEQYLKDNQITFKSELVDPKSLMPTQSQISLNGSFLKIGEILARTPVADLIVSKDNYVLDGHHRWAGAVLAEIQDPSVKLNVMRLSVDHNDALQTMYNFNHDYAISGQAHGVVRKYREDQARDDHGRFSVEDGSPSNLNAGFQAFDSENTPLALPSWANQTTRIDWREPHIGLSDKAKEVASRIGASTPPKLIEDRVRGELIESGKSTSAVYTAPDGTEYNLVYNRWSPVQNGAETTNGTVDAFVEDKRVAGLQFDGKNYFYNEDKNGNLTAYSATGQKSSFADISHIEVFPAYQRQGIATAMLEFARRETPDLGIIHSSNLTDKGRIFSSVTKFAPNALYSSLDGSCVVFDFLDGNNIYARVVSQDGTESDPQELDTILTEGDWQPVYPEDNVVKSLMIDLQKYSEDQPRDWHGRFSFAEEGSGGGGNSTPRDIVTVNDKNITKKLMDGSIEKLTVSQLSGNPIPITDILKPETNFSIAEMGQIAITGLLTRRENVDPESLKYADKQLQASLDKSTPSIQMSSDALEQILNQDRFSTLEELGSTVASFTTGVNDNHEDWYRGVRLMAENLWFNYDNNTNPAERPVYGYMRPNNATKATDDAFKVYGDIRVELNRDVLNRTTLSIGDSLNNTDTATPFNYGASMASTGFPQYKAIDQNDYYDDGSNGNYFSSKDFQSEFGYIEAQFHGGLDTADIAKVYLPKADENLQAMLDDAGVAWKVGRK